MKKKKKNTMKIIQRKREFKQYFILFSVAVVTLLGIALLKDKKSLAQLPSVGTPATVSKLDTPFSVREYPVYDKNGNLLRQAQWNVGNAGGNCCEDYLIATPTGRVVNLGGDYPTYTDDAGKTWFQVKPAKPSVLGGEGAISYAPGGDIVGISWYPYDADTIISYKYVASESKWYSQLVPLHIPQYDRPWVAVFKGPFTIGGVTVPYISMLKGGNLFKDPIFISLDGLNYAPASTVLGAGHLTYDGVYQFLSTKSDPDIDWLQPSIETGLMPFSGASGYALGLGSKQVYGDTAGALTYGCRWAVFTPSLKWSCYNFPDGSDFGILNEIQIDSNGYIHKIIRNSEKSIKYSLSKDGGRTWAEYVILPEGTPGIPSGSYINVNDFKTRTNLDMTAISVQFSLPSGEDRYVVYKLKNISTSIELSEIMHLGNGGYDFCGGITCLDRQRFDFVTLAILPNGKVATSYGQLDEDNAGRHRIAIEQ